MNLLGQILLTLLGALFLVTIVSVVVGIVRNVKQGMEFHQSLACRVKHLRLNKMLGRFGLDLPTYVHTTRAVDVEHHMQSCGACPTQDTCDQVLAEAPSAETDYGFCPNQDALETLSASVRSREAAIPSS
jgi:hypothetical protein